jgi:hypothetical protein
MFRLRPLPDADRTIAEADPKQAQAPLFIKELRVNAGSEIAPTYRIVTPAVWSLPSSWAELVGA